MIKEFNRRLVPFLTVLLFVFAGCVSGGGGLSLWNDGAPAKTALLEYIADTTDESSPDFIPRDMRVAVFDLDGTLCCETAPTYFDWLLFEHRVLDDQSWQPSPEQRSAALLGREKRIWPPLDAKRERMVSEAYKNLTIDELNSFVRKFMEEPQPGFSGMKRGEIFYRPMVEVVELLVENGFTVYVCSGTDRLVVRELARDALPIPPRQIIGSDSSIVARKQDDADGLAYVFEAKDELVLGGGFLVKNLQMNKVSAIVREIGIQPVLAFGNSFTDASMLNHVISGNRYKALAFMLLCDDLEREYGNMTRAGKMRNACEKYGWIPVSMRDDWKTIYGPDVKKTGL